MTWLVIFEDVHWARAVRAKLGDAFSPARVFRGSVPHDFIAVNETSTLESAGRQYAATGCGRRARHVCVRCSERRPLVSVDGCGMETREEWPKCLRSCELAMNQASLRCQQRKG